MPSEAALQLTALARQRIEGMRIRRWSWWSHWAALAEVYLPRRYKWFITPNQTNRGSAINQAIIDETGVLAARGLASGMLSGLTSPTRPWFRLGVPNEQLMSLSSVRLWLAECEKRLMKCFARSNFYQAMGVHYHDLAVFGSAAMIEYEDSEDIVRFYNPCLGEFFFGSSDRLMIDSLAREFTLNVTQCVQQFADNGAALQKLPGNVTQLWRNSGASRTFEVVVAHLIEPNTDLWQAGAEAKLPYIVPKKFAYREVYWIKGQEAFGPIKVAGYEEKPFIGTRWDTVSNDPYGRSPGMDGLPAVRQLQVEQRRKGEAIDKMVRPPMNASVSMKNEPASIMPGAVNYVVDTEKAGFKPAYQVDPRLQEMMLDIQEVQKRINSIFFMDLFMMISQLNTVRSATEIDARREEKLILLGPVIERLENEGLDLIIDRTFSIMMRRGLLPPPPAELQGMGQTLQIQYVSMLAEAQRAASTAAIERLLGLAGNISAADPSVLDNIDVDEAINEYADFLGVSPKVLRSSKAVAAIRQQRQQQQATMEQAQMAMAAAQGGKVLSQVKTGAGQNALESMFNA